VLSLGYFFHTSLGYNGLTLRVFKRLRYAVSVDVSAACLNVAVNVLLIPRYGALGAACGTSATLVAHNVLKQWGLHRYTGVSLFSRRYLPTYALLFSSAGALFALQMLARPSLWAAFALSGAVGLLVLWRARRTLELGATFPELARIPILRTAFAGSRP
jgi:O-antigen/teichoic acid export membrane protein